MLNWKNQRNWHLLNQIQLCSNTTNKDASHGLHYWTVDWCTVMKVVFSFSFAFTSNQAQRKSWTSIPWTQSRAIWSLLIGLHCCSYRTLWLDLFFCQVQLAVDSRKCCRYCSLVWNNCMCFFLTSWLKEVPQIWDTFCWQFYSNYIRNVLYYMAKSAMCFFRCVVLLHYQYFLGGV